MLLLTFFDQANLSFLQSFCISANQLTNLWPCALMAPRVRTQAGNSGAMGICAGNLCGPLAAAAAELQTAEPECSFVLRALPLSLLCVFSSPVVLFFRNKVKINKATWELPAELSMVSLTLTPYSLFIPSQVALNAFFFVVVVVQLSYQGFLFRKDSL